MMFLKVPQVCLAKIFDIQSMKVKKILSTFSYSKQLCPFLKNKSFYDFFPPKAHNLSQDILSQNGKSSPPRTFC